MVNITDITNITSTPIIEEVITNIGAITHLLEIIGGVFIFYIILIILRWRSNKDTHKVLEEINHGIKKLNDKIGNLKK